jgi:uncharacterized protein (DUF305 family)
MSKRANRCCSVLVVLAVLVVAAGCGGDDGKGNSSDVRANGTDAAFVNAMVPNHEASVDAADLALSRAEHRQLRQFAEGILQFRSAELTSLRSVRDVLQETGVEEGDLGVGDPEQGAEGAIESLRSAADFDCAYLKVMIPHTEGAISMAQAELKAGVHAELRRLAEIDVIDTQGTELRQMKRYQRGWCGTQSG